MKSSVEKIRARFDADVERFSNLETGQSAVVDSPLCMELVSTAAAAMMPGARDILDIGCGAGNYTLKLLEKLRIPESAEPPAVNCTLVDLSRPMLERAVTRITPRTRGQVRTLQGDMREVDLGESAFDILVTAATLHHLRAADQWQSMFARMFQAVRPGGCLWIFDMIEHVHPAIEALMRRRYGDYLVQLQGGGAAGTAFRDKVFAYIEEEDTPRPLVYQLDLLRAAGFVDLDVLHKTSMGAVFGGRKP